jgi:hypothetical protein
MGLRKVRKNWGTKMQQVKDTSGEIWNVYKVLPFYSGYTQINIGKKCSERAITLPENLAERWIAGEIRVKVR